MANVFLSGAERDIETAIMLEQAVVHDIENAVAYTDGDRVFINTDDNLYKILPAYNHKMLKWLLWHERFHKELRHHNRFFRYLSELRDKEIMDEFAVTKQEVNIIMDILVHDSLSKLFPELVETAVNNLAQMRNRNSLEYTFKTFTLEEMLDEFKEHKKSKSEKGAGAGAGREGEGEGEEKETSDKKGKGKAESSEPKEEPEKKDETEKKKDMPKEHAKGGSSTDRTSGKGKDKAPELDEKAETPELPSEHDKTDWKKLEKIDSKEFIDKDEGDYIVEQVNKLKRKKFKLGKLTERLNGMVTSTRQRTYSKPNPIKVGSGVILKGSKPGRTPLYLCFDASGSMGCELETFKEIISKSIPQAMDVPCEWFTCSYGKGKFRDIMGVHAYSGFDDDGDRVIDLCWKAEQAGYSPIGVTDGGGRISWSKPKLQQLKRTVLVGQNRRWLDAAQKINPRVQILDI